MSGMIVNEHVLQRWARLVLRDAMAEAKVTYPLLAERLKEIGLDETEPSVRNKIQRGTYSAGFLAAALSVLGVESLPIQLFTFADRLSKLPTREQAEEFHAKLRDGQYACLSWSMNAPNTSFEAITLPDDRYRGTRKRTALLCGNCEATVFDGWLESDASRAFAGKPAFGRCSACSAYIGIPGSSLPLDLP
jgi:hypothetical protein